MSRTQPYACRSWTNVGKEALRCRLLLPPPEKDQGDIKETRPYLQDSHTRTVNKHRYTSVEGVIIEEGTRGNYSTQTYTPPPHPPACSQLAPGQAPENRPGQHPRQIGGKRTNLRTTHSGERWETRTIISDYRKRLRPDDAPGRRKNSAGGPHPRVRDKTAGIPPRSAGK